ncbi:FKBP-type peptidyl-prolyl cis-trans isomerase [Ferruginibacter profundus]
MKQFLNAAVICVIALASCTTPFKKNKDGSEYKIISVTKGAKLLTGNFMELNVLAKYKDASIDTVLFSTIEEGMPQYGLYDTANFPMPFKEVFKNIHVGDSIVLRIPTDSILAKSQAQPGQTPPAYMKKGQFIYQYYTITNSYTTKEQVDSAQKTHMKVARERGYKKQLEQVEKMIGESKADIEKDDKVIEEYLAKNNIKATKTKWGTYIAVQNEGTGEKITTSETASINYTGKTFDSSKVFDSNTDPKFKHIGAYDVNMGQLSGLILGWFDAIAQMKKGTKATVYIPSALGYGKEGRGPDIKPGDILVFDMEVVDVMNEEALQAKQQAMQKQQMEAQQKMMDSIQKAQKNTAAPAPKK